MQRLFALRRRSKLPASRAAAARFRYIASGAAVAWIAWLAILLAAGTSERPATAIATTAKLTR